VAGKFPGGLPISGRTLLYESFPGGAMRRAKNKKRFEGLKRGFGWHLQDACQSLQPAC
jgi:hypothetical protein